MIRFGSWIDVFSCGGVKECHTVPIGDLLGEIDCIKNKLSSFIIYQINGLVIKCVRQDNSVELAYNITIAISVIINPQKNTDVLRFSGPS